MANVLGFDPARLAAIDDFLDRKYVQSGRLPGTLTLVARRGEVAHMGVRGFADVERGTQLAEDTIFRIYSMTKPLTSVALMMLVEEGRIALDDPVHRYIPEWRDLGVFVAGTHKTGMQTRPVKRPMQVVDLLRHTAGLTYGFQLRTNVDAAYRSAKIGEIEKAGTLDDMIASLAKLPLEFSPGDAWNYSVATDVCGYLVGKVAGEPFEAFLQRRLLDPLGMVDTGFQVREGESGRFAACYTPTRDGKIELQDDPATSTYLAPPSFVSGGGGLVSTAADYLKFAQAMLAGGRTASRRTPDRPQDARPDDRQPPARRRRPASIVGVAVQRGGVRGRRLRPRLRHLDQGVPHPDAGQRRRLFLGRRRQHLLLGRSGRGDRRGIHDPADPQLDLPGPPRGQDDGVRRARRLTRLSRAAP